MLRMLSYVWLLLLLMCCWHCMARHTGGKPRVPVDSSYSDEDSSSGEKGPSCTDGKRNRDETDIDCGGNQCAKCGDRKTCMANCDCISGFCKSNRCAQRSTKPTTTTVRTKPPVRTTTVSEVTFTTASEEISTTTSEEISMTASEETSTRAFEVTFATASEEISTTAPEETSVTASEVTFTAASEEASTTAPEETSTTASEETSTTAFEVASTTAPEVTTTEALVITMTTSPTCDFECKNNGTCTSHNNCTCKAGFSGPTCEVQSVGLCLNNETFHTKPLLLITFGNGLTQYSTSTPTSFNFSTTYRQRFEPVTDDGMFSFVNSVHDDFNGAWHTGAKDHSEGNNGYMYLVNADYKPGQFYKGTVNNLCVGLRYEFSVYLANLCKPSGKINPNVLFEVRSVVGNELLAQLESGDVAEHSSLTWEKYGFSFIASSSSVNLLMISNTRGGGGNDLVIDDIALHVCAHAGTGFCPSN